MKIRVNEMTTTHTQDYAAIPEPIKTKLRKYTVMVMHDNEQERYTAVLAKDTKTMTHYIAAPRWTIITALAPEQYVRELDARQSNIKNGLLTPDYSSIDTCDSAYLVAYELLRLKILQLAGERV